MEIFRHRVQDYSSAKNHADNVEVDVRSYIDDGGKVFPVLCHDIDETDIANYALQSYLQTYLKNRREGIIALNIKEDGLAPYIKEALEEVEFPTGRVFCFDMSSTEIPIYLEEDLPIATRVSEYGIENPIGDYILFDWYGHTDCPSKLYVPMVCIARDYYGIPQEKLVEKKIVAISPELHGSENLKPLWEFARNNHFWGIITDRVEKAQEYFS